MRQINTRIKHENIIRSILAIIGILCLVFQRTLAGLYLGGIVFKENIRLRTKEGWVLLILTSE